MGMAVLVIRNLERLERLKIKWLVLVPDRIVVMAVECIWIKN
jgi:hypothetical protein